MNEDDLRAAFGADDGMLATPPGPEALAGIRNRIGTRRRARFAGVAVVITTLLVAGAAVVGLGGGTDESGIVIADTPTTAGTSGDGSAEPVKVLLTGDSFAVMLATGFSSNPETSAVALASNAQLGCGLVPLARVSSQGVGEPCEAWYEGDGLRALEQFEPDLVVHALGPTDVLDAVADDGTSVPVVSGGYQRAFEEELDRYANAVHDTGAAFAVLASPTYDSAEPGAPSALTQAGADRVDFVNRLVLNQHLGYESVEGVGFIPAEAWLCVPDGPCVTATGSPLRPDGVHLSVEGASEAAARLTPLLLGLIAAGEGPGDVEVDPTPPPPDPSLSTPTTPPDDVPSTGPANDACSQVTTIPSCTQPSPTQTPPPTTPQPGAPIDCGGAYPISGWPTTMMSSAEGADCIVAAFAAGADATYWVIDFVQLEGGGTDQTMVERRDFHVTGPSRVDVVIGRRPFGNGPFDPYGELHGCTSLTKVWPDSQQVTVSGCS